MRPEHIEGVVALAAGEPTAPHWPRAEYSRMLEVIASTPGRRGAWVLLDRSREGAGLASPDIPRQVSQERISPLTPEKKTASRVALSRVPRQKASSKMAHRYGPLQLATGILGGSAVSAELVVGFAMASHVAGVCDLEAVVVYAGVRGRRLGELLVGSVAGWGELLGATRLELEVRASNAAALRLYRRMGFTLDGSRPGYYCNPVEEAVLMSLRLASPDLLA